MEMSSFYKRLAEEYSLEKHHFWKHDKSQKWILHHSGVEVIQSKEHIKYYTARMRQETSEIDGEKSQHIVWACVAWIPGEKEYIVEITPTDCNVYDPLEVVMVKQPCDLLVQLKVMAAPGKISVEKGEGDNTNFRAGYKDIIVEKRAFDRAVLAIIQDKFEHMLLTGQDAEIIEGQSSIGASLKSVQQTAREEEEASAAQNKAFNSLNTELKKWIVTVGWQEAQKMLDSSKSIFSSLSDDQKSKLLETLEKAKEMDRVIQEEKKKEPELQKEQPPKHDPEKEPSKEPAKEPAKEPKDAKPEPATPSIMAEMTDEEKSLASPSQISDTIALATNIWKQPSKYKARTVYTEHLEEIRLLPEGLKSYLRRVIADKNAEGKGK